MLVLLLFIKPKTVDGILFSNGFKSSTGMADNPV